TAARNPAHGRPPPAVPPLVGAERVRPGAGERAAAGSGTREGRFLPARVVRAPDPPAPAASLRALTNRPARLLRTPRHAPIRTARPRPPDPPPPAETRAHPLDWVFQALRMSRLPAAQRREQLL